MKRLSLILLVLVALPPMARAQSLFMPMQHSTAYEANHDFNGSKLVNLTISFHTAAYRTLMIFDLAAVPGDGALTTAQKAALVYCYEGITQSTDPAEQSKALSFVNNGLIFQTGIAVTVSTSTSGCTTLTSDGANMWFSGQAIQ